jgi:hypothetical protein
MEQNYVFIKNNRVAQVAVFASQDEVLADAVAQEHGYDDAVWVGENKPAMWSTYDGTTFTAPTLDYLYEIGASDENTEMMEERLAQVEIAKAEENAQAAAKAAAKAELLAALNLSQETLDILNGLN